MFKSFTEALQNLTMTQKLSKEFKLTEQTTKELHAHAMHFVT